MKESNLYAEEPQSACEILKLLPDGGCLIRIIPVEGSLSELVSRLSGDLILGQKSSYRSGHVTQWEGWGASSTHHS